MKTKLLLPVVILAAVDASVALCGETDEAVQPELSVEVIEVPAKEVPAKPSPAKEVPVAKAPEASGFYAKLTADERVSAGLVKLSLEQLAMLDVLVAKEVKAARQGNVTAFAGTFISRRTDAERAALGVGILTTGEKYQLDRLVSRALATTPAQPPVLITRPPAESDLSSKPFKWETHGFVQLEYGWGSGDREYKAATVGVAQVNPKTGTMFTVEYTAAEGDGMWSPRGCRFHVGSGPW